MAPQNPQVLVVGDPAVDWFIVPVKRAEGGPNWRLSEGARQWALPGGALLTELLIRRVLDGCADVAETKLDESLHNISPADMVQSTNLLRDQDGEGNGPLFVARSFGQAGPMGTPRWPNTPDLKRTPDILVVDDGGNGFRDDTAMIDRVRENITDDTVVLLKTTQPLFEGELFNAMAEHGAKTGNLVVVLSADDMRVIDGVKISRGLSWERTAKETIFALRRNSRLGRFDKCPHLVIRFGLAGALHASCGDSQRYTLHFHGHRLEQGPSSGQCGVVGASSWFVAFLTRKLIELGIAGIGDGIGGALDCARRSSTTGYRVANSGGLKPPTIDPACQDPSSFGKCTVPEISSEHANALGNADPDRWRIADGHIHDNGSVAAEEIIRVGPERARGVRRVPMTRYGHLVLIDRAETEAYAAAGSLIHEYLMKDTAIPLCLGVFGPPGSGKSFGVKQIVKSMHQASVRVMSTFNVSQFRSYGDLTAAFHKVRDEVLAGHCPMVFFDEFDSDCEGKPLGWLKYFLAPMEDGEFREGDSVYHTGKAIFVFAGGTRSSFEKFEKNEPDETDGAAPGRAGNWNSDKARLEFRAAKGSDFASRLRGFINVMGPNRKDEADDAHILRRAVLLHALLRINAGGIFGGRGGGARIDTALCRAFLHVGSFKHGARSMGSIIAMSGLTGAERYTVGSLPTREQLAMHVDADEFLWLAARERFASKLSRKDFVEVTTRALAHVGRHACLKGLSAGLSEESRIDRERALVLRIAFEINESYRARRTKEGRPDWAVEFSKLTPDLLRSNLDAAESLPERLREIGHGLRLTENPEETEIPREEVERLAVLEHSRFNGERRTAGWRWAKEKDREARRSPYLIDWVELLEKYPEVAEFDREGVVDGFTILNGLGMETFAL